MESRAASSKGTQLGLYLAFGSLHFQVTDAAPEHFKGEEYLGWIGERLGEIAAVGSIEITAHESEYERAAWSRPKEVQRYGDAGIAFPPLQFVEMGFTLHVPQRVQRQLADRGLSVPDTLGEDFVVKVQDGWQMPNAMVWPFDCQVPQDAANAVIVVREILQQEFARLKDSPVKPEWLGPSPAHFTAELMPGEQDQSEDFEEQSRRRNGYHSYTFGYRKSLGTPASVADDFHLAINSELDLHYRIERASRGQGRAWGEAAEEIQKVLGAYRASGVRAPFARILQGRRINRALIALAEIELGQTQELQNLQMEFDSTYQKGDHVLIQAPLRINSGSFDPYR
jgi:hypothetical protein